MAARRPFWKWHRWKSIGFCLWPPSICIWNLKLKFQSKLDLCSGNHVVYRQTDRRTDGRTRWIQYTPPSNFVGRGYNDDTVYVSSDHNELKLCFIASIRIISMRMRVINCDVSSGTIWWSRSGSTLAQVMAWCLMAPSHCLNQYWHYHQWSPVTITWGQFHSEDTSATNC